MLNYYSKGGVFNMKNRIINIVSIFILFALIYEVQITTVIAKNDYEVWKVQYDETGPYLKNTITGETMSGFVSASGEKISILEMKEMLNKNLIDNKNNVYIETQITPSELLLMSVSTTSTLPYNFTKRMEWVSWKLNQFKVTPTIVGPATITYGSSVTTTESFSFSLGAATEPIKSLLRANASFTWSNSSSSSSNFGATFPVAAGKAGYVAFSPAYNNISADVTVNGVTSIVSGSAPKKLVSGFTDGYYSCLNCN